MFINITNLLGTGSSSSGGWKAWLKYILQQEKDLSLSKAALVHQKGSVAASTNGFNLKSSDIKVIRANIFLYYITLVTSVTIYKTLSW